jgi:hypothetical protein
VVEFVDGKQPTKKSRKTKKTQTKHPKINDLKRPMSGARVHYSKSRGRTRVAGQWSQKRLRTKSSQCSAGQVCDVFGRVSLVWCGVVWCGVVWCGVVWCGVVWCGVVWCGMVWCGVAWWCSVVSCGVGGRCSDKKKHKKKPKKNQPKPPTKIAEKMNLWIAQVDSCLLQQQVWWRTKRFLGAPSHQRAQMD